MDSHRPLALVALLVATTTSCAWTQRDRRVRAERV